MGTEHQIQKQEVSLQPSDPANLLQIAVQQNFDLDKLQRLIDMQNQWEQKQAKKSFLAALSKFQTLVPVLKKAKTANVKMNSGGTFSYKYADLGSITQAIKKPLNECGLSYRWEFFEENGKMKVTCFVSHIDGHTETTTMEAKADSSGAKNDIQQKGSTHTYLQRYTLIGALGLATADEDNDGSSRKPPKKEELSEEEIMEQWKQTIGQCKTKTHLTSVYLQNKAAVDGSPKLKELFKERENAIKAAIDNKTAVMP